MTENEPFPIAFFGKNGSHSHMAVLEFSRRFNVQLQPFSAVGLDSLIDTVLHQTKLGIIPIENSCDGTVDAHIDSLLVHDMRIVGEINLPIENNLVGWSQPEENFSGGCVISHPKALNQCRQFTRLHGMHQQLAEDTASAAAHVAQLVGADRYTHFAIANSYAAREYGLTILHSNINDYKYNTTRFVVIRPPNIGTHPFENALPFMEGMRVTLAALVSPHHLNDVLAYFKSEGYYIKATPERPNPFRDPDSERVYERIYYIEMGVPNLSGGSKLVRRPLNEIIDAINAKISGQMQGRAFVKLMGLYPKDSVSKINYGNKY